MAAAQKDVEAPVETTPLAPVRVEDAAEPRESCRVVVFGMLAIACSVVLINFNKYLMTPGVFSFPMHLVLLHMSSGSLFTFILFRLAPSMFPAMQNSVLPVRTLILKAVPVAICFAGNLVLSNMAYLHASVAFLQFMKEANIVMVYMLALLVGTEFLSSEAVCILLFVVGATTCCVRGEVHFSLAAFFIQGSSQLFEVVRITLQAMLLSGQGLKLDVLTFVLLVMPWCVLILAAVMAVLHGLQTVGLNPMESISSPTWEDFASAWPLLLANSFCALLLNIANAQFIKSTSAMGLVFCGLLKDCTVVVLSLFLFTETISGMQVLGFGGQIVGVLVWSLMKTFPKEFAELGVLGGTYAALFGSSAPDLRMSKHVDFPEPAAKETKLQ